MMLPEWTNGDIVRQTYKTNTQMRKALGQALWEAPVTDQAWIIWPWTDYLYQFMSESTKEETF